MNGVFRSFLIFRSIPVIGELLKPSNKLGIRAESFLLVIGAYCLREFLSFQNNNFPIKPARKFLCKIFFQPIFPRACFT